MKVLLLADVSNIYYCLKKRFGGGKLNYKKLLEYMSKYGDLYRAYAYTSQVQTQADKFFDCLTQFGYRVKVKVPKEYPGAVAGDQSRVIRKANWDVGMAIDMVRHLDKVDSIVLCSADGDFAPAALYAIEQAVDVHVLACGISKDLKDVVTSWTEIGPQLLEETNNEPVKVA